MLRLVGERHDFRFDAGTITGTDTFDLSIIKRRVGGDLPVIYRGKPRS